MTALVVAELTEATVAGVGVFDVLMRANKAHLEQELLKGRLLGPEYATVYLGSLDAVLRTSLEFLLHKRKNDLEAQLLEKQILLATAQQELLVQQKVNAIAEALNIPKQGVVLDKQALDIEAKTALTEQQTLNAVTEGLLLTSQKAKVDAEKLLVDKTVLKTDEEIALLAQKTLTEAAQVSSVGVDADSVIGKQKTLYQRQADGFLRDAEQKGTKILVDTWNSRRLTDEATVVDATNKLSDTYVGNAVAVLLTGMGA